MTKYALISGGAGGIGSQLAIQFAKRNYTVIATAPQNHLFEIEQLTKEYPNIIPYACDITNVDQITKLKEFVKKTTGGYLHILYNNAGISIAGPATEFDDNQMMTLFKVNVFGHMYMTKYMSEFIMAAKGAIIFTSSVAARAPLSWVSLYCSTKAAIDQYAWCLRTEMQPFGVRVYSVITGGVDTGICDANVTAPAPGSPFDVDGVYDSMRSSAQMSRITNVSPQKYAQGVVSIVESKSSVFNIYKGARAFLIHCGSRYLPIWLFEFLVSRHFLALKVWRNIRKKVKEQSKKSA
jgi:NAD(P)-dependent dehydrogenase (short-subunit alcohol dehydrogenase family)